jgi:hypothetical protein
MTGASSSWRMLAKRAWRSRAAPAAGSVMEEPLPRGPGL